MPTFCKDTAFGNSKIIRLKRSNLWDRYKSLNKALATNVWHAQSGAVPLFIDIDDMIGLISWMEQVDEYGDKWVNESEAEVLHVEYDECRASPAECKSRMFNFLGVDSSSLVSTDQKGSTYSKSGSLEGIVNGEEVAEALNAHGFGHFIDRTTLTNYTKLQLLVFETDPLKGQSPAEYFVRTSKEISSINVTLVGQGKTFLGFGSKYSGVIEGMALTILCYHFIFLSYQPLVFSPFHQCVIIQHWGIFPKIV